MDGFLSETNYVEITEHMDQIETVYYIQKIRRM